jgi:hypothetical protein
MAISAINPTIFPVDYPTATPAIKRRNSNFKVIPGGAAALEIRLNSRKFLLLMASVVSLNILVVAGLNILMTQDAFELQKLKHDRNIAMDQKDAIAAQVNFKNSPDQLSLAALKLGMVPAPEIKYIDLAKTP